MRITATIAILVSLSFAGVALAQAASESRVPQQGVTGEPPTVGGGSSEPLSDQLAQSKGVICPPAGVDREIHVAPPDGGKIRVIPPPGTPGGDQSLQPK